MRNLLNKLKRSPINYFSDLFIIGTVLFWMLFCLVGEAVAVIVTFSSIAVSIESGISQYDVQLWGIVSTVVLAPITVGVGGWLVKCAGQHWMANKRGEKADYDFPDDEDPVEPDEEVKG